MSQKIRLMSQKIREMSTKVRGLSQKFRGLPGLFSRPDIFPFPPEDKQSYFHSTGQDTITGCPPSVALTRSQDSGVLEGPVSRRLPSVLPPSGRCRDTDTVAQGSMQHVVFVYKICDAPKKGDTSDMNPTQSVIDKLAERIAKFGWTTMTVFPLQDSDAPYFTYSIGFQARFHCPEVLFVGFSKESSNALIAGLASSLERGDIPILAAGERRSDVVRDMDVLVEGIPQAEAAGIARFAEALRGPEKLQLVQVVLPDESGLLPGEPGCNPKFVSFQDRTRLRP